MASVRFCTLLSGSSANAAFIECNGSAILIDAGAGVRKLGTELESIGSGWDKVLGIFITHEHADHIGGLPTILRRFRIPVFGNEQTLRAMLYALPTLDPSLLHIMKSGACACRDGFSVRSFRTSHDSVESVGYVVSAGGFKLGLMTDTGVYNESMAEAVEGCDALVLESNHDEEMLRTGPYPYPLRRRIAGSGGHLSNRQCGDFLLSLREPPKNVILAHISAHNNTPALARETVAARIAALPVSLSVAPADRHGDVLCFGELPCLR